jgi:hypothetical protein
MKYRIFTILILALTSFYSNSTSLSTVRDESDTNNDVARVVKAFYSYHFTHDMGFTKQSIVQKRRWLDKEFYELMLAEEKKNNNPDEAPFINGDPFTDSQEYPDTFEVVKSTKSGSQATVKVLFIWKQSVRSAQIVLSKQKNRWLIYNIIHDSDFDFRDYLTKNNKR